MEWRLGVGFGDAWKSRESRVAVRGPVPWAEAKKALYWASMGARKTKDGRRRRGKERVVKQAPGLGADERAAGEIGSELS